MIAVRGQILGEELSVPIQYVSYTQWRLNTPPTQSYISCHWSYAVSYSVKQQVRVVSYSLFSQLSFCRIQHVVKSLTECASADESGSVVQLSGATATQRIEVEVFRPCIILCLCSYFGHYDLLRVEDSELKNTLIQNVDKLYVIIACVGTISADDITIAFAE